MRALCVGRHRFLSEHLGRFFRELGLETTCVVGMPEARAVAHDVAPDVVIVDYDLLATTALDDWERDTLTSLLPVVAVSLTRRPNEVHLLDINGIAGFLYLPTLQPDDARRLLAGAKRRPAPVVAPPDAPYSLPTTLEWPRPSTTAR